MSACRKPTGCVCDCYPGHKGPCACEDAVRLTAFAGALEDRGAELILLRERAERAERERDEARADCDFFDAERQKLVPFEAEAAASRALCDRLAEALVESAGICESLAASVAWELAPSILERIRDRTVVAARAALAEYQESKR